MVKIPDCDWLNLFIHRLEATEINLDAITIMVIFSQNRNTDWHMIYIYIYI